MKTREIGARSRKGSAVIPRRLSGAHNFDCHCIYLCFVYLCVHSRYISQGKTIKTLLWVISTSQCCGSQPCGESDNRGGGLETLKWPIWENNFKKSSVQFSCSVVSDSATPWTATPQASLSITSSWRLLKLMSIKSVMPSNHLILCCPLLLLPSIFPSIWVFSNESVLHIRWPKYWSFGFTINPSSE